MDGSVGIEPVAVQALDAEGTQALARRTLLDVDLGGDRDLGQAQRRRRHPQPRQPAHRAQADEQRQHQHATPPARHRDRTGQGRKRQHHRHAERELVALHRRHLQDQRQYHQQQREQGQRVKAQEQPAPLRQPAEIHRVDDGDQRHHPEQAGEQRLATVPRGAGDEERQREEQALLVGELGQVTHQHRRQPEAEARRHRLAERALDHQKHPARQHRHRHQPRHALVTLDEQEAQQPGHEAEGRDQPGVAAQPDHPAQHAPFQQRHASASADTGAGGRDGNCRTAP